MAEQLGLDLAGKPALGREDFLVAPSNALAVSLIEAWPDWHSGKLVLSGPPGSGKTHLVHVWAAMSGARIINAKDIGTLDIPTIANSPLAIEEVPLIAGNVEEETKLFHLHNMALANGQTLLFSGGAALASWNIQLADLKSRLQGATEAQLQPPDDALLHAVLAKLFADRQILPKPDVIPYLVSHMDRSFAAAREIVRRIDRQSLAEGRAITRQLAARILGEDA